MTQKRVKSWGFIFGLIVLLILQTSVFGQGSGQGSGQDPCASITCVWNAICTVTQGSPTCTCDAGYEGDGTNICSDIDECSRGTYICHENADCWNHVGSYSCHCSNGYTGTQYSCSDIDECASGHHTCSTNSICMNISGNYTCECDIGYTEKNATFCGDIDECNENPFPCTDAELCVNTIGSYDCQCVVGYTMSVDGCIPVMCQPVDMPCNQLDSLIDLCASAMNGVDSVAFPAAVAGYSTTSDTKCSINTPNVDVPLGSRICQLDGTWANATWLGSCGTGLTDVASQVIETEDERIQVSASLQILTSNVNRLTVTDVSTTSDAIENVINSASSISVSTATSVISTISNVLESPHLTVTNQTSRFVTHLDTAASRVELQSSQIINAVSNNVAVLVTSSNASVGDISMIMVVRPNTDANGFRSDQFTITNMSFSSGNVVDGEQVQASISVAAEAIGDIPSKVYVKAIGNSNNQFPIDNNLRYYETGNIRLSRLVLSATIDNRSISNLSSEARVQYSLPASYDTDRHEALCVFWNESTNSWGDKGCRLAETTVYALTCSCDHLTNFAALLRRKPTKDPTKPTPLDIVTIVGCSLSTAALLILIVLFACIPKSRTGRKFQGSFLLLNLYIALLGLNITLLISETPFIAYAGDYAAISSSCRTIAIFLHIFLLASSAWMNCEGVMLFLAVVKPLYTRAYLTDKSVVLLSVAWGWIMPTIFVGITALVDVSVYTYPHNDGFAVTCWINSVYVVNLAVVPIAIMISGNLMIYIILTYRLCWKRKAEWDRVSRASRESYQRKICINLSILIMLGITWIFGFFIPAIEDKTTALVFAYIFTIFNSLQGFFFLLLHVIRNKHIRLMFTRDASTLYSNRIGLGSAMSRGSRRAGKSEPSFSIGESSFSSSNVKSSKMD